MLRFFISFRPWPLEDTFNQSLQYLWRNEWFQLTIEYVWSIGQNLDKKSNLCKTLDKHTFNCFFFGFCMGVRVHWRTTWGIRLWWSSPMTRDTHKYLPSVWHWSCHYLFLRLRSVAVRIRTPIILLAVRTPELTATQLRLLIIKYILNLHF